MPKIFSFFIFLLCLIFFCIFLQPSFSAQAHPGRHGAHGPPISRYRMPPHHHHPPRFFGYFFRFSNPGFIAGKYSSAQWQTFIPTGQNTTMYGTGDYTYDPSFTPSIWETFFHSVAEGYESEDIIGFGWGDEEGEEPVDIVDPGDYTSIFVSSVPEAEQNISEIVANTPNSPAIFKDLPGYTKFRGVLISGNPQGAVSVGTGTEVLGGVYTNGKLAMKEGAVITADIYYLTEVIDHFLPVLPGAASRFNILSSSGSPVPSNPMNLREIPRRAQIINTYEISPSEAASTGLPK